MIDRDNRLTAVNTSNAQIIHLELAFNSNGIAGSNHFVIIQRSVRESNDRSPIAMWTLTGLLKELIWNLIVHNVWEIDRYLILYGFYCACFDLSLLVS